MQSVDAMTDLFSQAVAIAFAFLTFSPIRTQGNGGRCDRTDPTLGIFLCSGNDTEEGRKDFYLHQDRSVHVWIYTNTGGEGWKRSYLRPVQDREVDPKTLIRGLRMQMRTDDAPSRSAETALKALLE